MSNPEVWRQITGFSSYEVSSHGRARRRVDGPNMKAQSILKPGITPNGYVKFGMTGDDGHRRTVSAHRLVAMAFLPRPHDGAVYVLHANDVKTDNRVENLRWGTPAENTADAVRNDRLALGDSHPCHVKPWTRPRGESIKHSKLTEDQVLEIFNDKRKQRDIAAEYGVDQALIGRIRNGKVWRHLTDPEYRALLVKNGAIVRALSNIITKARAEARPGG